MVVSTYVITKLCTWLNPCTPKFNRFLWPQKYCFAFLSTQSCFIFLYVTVLRNWWHLIQGWLRAGWPDEFVKILPKMQPNPFLSKLTHNFYRGKRSPRIRATSVIIKNVQFNNRPSGENSPNPVTLAEREFFTICMTESFRFSTEWFWLVN
jgi:hypothetical protein